MVASPSPSLPPLSSLLPTSLLRTSPSCDLRKCRLFRGLLGGPAEGCPTWITVRLRLSLGGCDLASWQQAAWQPGQAATQQAWQQPAWQPGQAAPAPPPPKATGHSEGTPRRGKTFRNISKTCGRRRPRAGAACRPGPRPGRRVFRPLYDQGMRRADSAWGVPRRAAVEPAEADNAHCAAMLSGYEQAERRAPTFVFSRKGHRPRVLF